MSALKCVSFHMSRVCHETRTMLCNVSVAVSLASVSSHHVLHGHRSSSSRDCKTLVNLWFRCFVCPTVEGVLQWLKFELVIQILCCIGAGSHDSWSKQRE